jgi:phosphoglycerate dehydrogenase-like enzyme
MTPHTAGATTTARTRGLETLAENTLKLLDGEPVNERFMAT